MTAEGPVFRWCDGVLWRDTGRHVVVNGPQSDRRVEVLSGGSVLVWRLLAQPATAEELLGELAPLGVSTREEIEECLEELAGRGLLERSVRSVSRC